MARLRTLKPSFFTNDSLAEIPPLGRLLFQGLWCIADREGRLEDRPRKIKAEVLPYDDVDADAMLDALAEHGFIRRYTAASIRYIQVTNFTKHQSPHKMEAASTIPAPDKHHASTVQAPCDDGLIVGSGYLDPVVGSNSGEWGAEAPAAAPPPAATKPPVVSPAPKGRVKRANTPPPDSFPITVEMEEWADATCPDVDLEAETQRFLDSARSHGRTYANWLAAWRGWMTNDYPKAMKNKKQGNSPIPLRKSNEAAKFDISLTSLQNVGGNRGTAHVSDQHGEDGSRFLRRVESR